MWMMGGMMMSVIVRGFRWRVAARRDDALDGEGIWDARRGGAVWDDGGVVSDGGAEKARCDEVAWR